MTISASFLGVSVPTPAFETGATDILNGGGLSQPEKPGAAAPPLAIRRRDSPSQFTARESGKMNPLGYGRSRRRRWLRQCGKPRARASSEIAARKAPEVVFDTLPCWRSPRCCANPLRRQRTGRPAAESAARNRSRPGGRAREGPTAHRAQRDLRAALPVVPAEHLGGHAQCGRASQCHSDPVDGNTRDLRAALALAVALATPAVRGS
jgi:hypothetical protein